MAVRSLLARVAKLEQARTPNSPFALAYGSLEAWEAECHAGIDEGCLDSRDMPIVMMAVRRWHSEGAWEGSAKYLPSKSQPKNGALREFA